MEAQPIKHEVYLWYVLAERITDFLLIERYRTLLSPEETEQERSFDFEEDRLHFLITRALVRTVLSSYTGHDPSSWKFARTPHGKPAVVAPQVDLQFNLARTRELVICAINHQRQLGVDVENIEQEVDHSSLARKYFAPSEVTALDHLPLPERRAAFFELWTLKEAYVKARGEGLALRLDSFALTRSPGGAIRIEPTIQVPVDPRDWQFASILLAGRYQIGLAVEATHSEQLATHIRETIPLKSAGVDVLLPENGSRTWRL
jgi:4'-phosphopantetheinyl transferase